MDLTLTPSEARELELIAEQLADDLYGSVTGITRVGLGSFERYQSWLHMVRIRRTQEATT